MTYGEVGGWVGALSCHAYVVGSGCVGYLPCLVSMGHLSHVGPERTKRSTELSRAVTKVHTTIFRSLLLYKAAPLIPLYHGIHHSAHPPAAVTSSLSLAMPERLDLRLGEDAIAVRVHRVEEDRRVRVGAGRL